MQWCSLVALALCSLIVGGAVAAQAPATGEGPDMTVGVFYFPGWERPESWYCMKANTQVQHPLLGYYPEGNAAVAEQHIRWAVDHGVGFFAFDYYSEGGSQMLEHALDDGFLKARNIGQFRFCLNWCNHSDASLMDEKELDAFADIAPRKYLGHPSYLRLHGKPVVIILAGYSFVKTLGIEKAKAAFARFDKRAKDAGLNGVTFVFCEGYVNSTQAVTDSLAAGCHGFCLYNYPYSGTGVTGPGKHAEATYADLTQQGEALWKHWRGITGGRFWPTVMPGWDRRPWTKDADLVRTGSTPALFRESLVKSRDYVNEDRVVMVEAWNEWGEGSVVEPSAEHGFAYLDQIRSVMWPDAPPHRDVAPTRTYRGPALPSISTWRFDRDAEGWTRSNTTEPAVNWGALTFTSLSGDPQIVSPATYLQCAKYRSASIRMRLTGPIGAMQRDNAQLFWSTTDHAFVENACATFEVQADGKWHDYEVPLRSNAGWTGMTDKLRFDPTTLADVKIEIDEIRLVQ